MKRFLHLFVAILIVFSTINITMVKADAEIIYSYSFEDGLSDWEYLNQFSDEVITFTKSCSTDGERAVYITDISNELNYGIISPNFDVTVGEAYSYSVDCFRIEGPVKMYVRFYNERGDLLFNKSATVSEGKWGNIVRTHAAPEGAVYTNVYLCTDSKYFSRGYFDNFIFAKGVLKENQITDGRIPPSDEGIPREEEPDGIPVGEVIFSDSFENGYSGWSNMSKKEPCEIIKGEAYDGEYSVKITDNSDTATAGLSSPLIPVTPGCKYTANVFLKTVTGNSVRMYFKFFDENEKQLDYKSILSLNSNWISNYVMLTAPENAVYCRMQIVGTSNLLGVAYADMATVTKGYVAPSFEGFSYSPPMQKEAIEAEIVKPVNNKLTYTAYTDKGDVLGNFSHAGFYGGDYLLPVTDNLPVAEELSPSGTGDDTLMLQEAIDRAERTDGGINVIKLNAGRYYINTDGITVKSGVLLSGEGQGSEGTILYAYKPYQHTMIKVEGEAYKESEIKTYITDEYIPSGSKTINIPLEEAKSYKVGDEILLRHNSTEAWSKAIGMWDIINLYDNYTTWQPDKINMLSRRRIIGIKGTEITLDFGVFVPHMKNLSESYITKLDISTLVRNSGIENLRMESYYNGEINDERHAVTAIVVRNAENIFIRNLTSKYFYFGLIDCDKGAKNITAENCSCLMPISKVEGARRYSFVASTGSQQFLCTGCYSQDARHDYATSGQANGPIAFVDNVVEMSHSTTESHGTWATGLLYDNVYHIGDSTESFTALANRGYYGTSISQGWSAAGSVIWNGLASTLLAHKPPLNYQNFLVGVYGTYEGEINKTIKQRNITSFMKNYRTDTQDTGLDENFLTVETSPLVGDSYKEAEFNPVEPRSLYKAQLSERYTGLILNERPNAPVFTYPAPDKVFDKNEIEIKGFYQLGASRVTVYVDNKPYEADLGENNTFNLSLNLEDGTHKIYATQHIKGYEGNKTADRFIIINEAKGNFDYLQSVYSPDVTTMLLNDPRPTFDVVINSPKITGVSYEKDGNDYSFSIFMDKGKSGYDKGEIVVALYTKSGKLCGVTKKVVSLDEKVLINVKASDEVGFIKIMLWENMGDIAPLCKPYQECR